MKRMWPKYRNITMPPKIRLRNTMNMDMVLTYAGISTSDCIFDSDTYNIKITNADTKVTKAKKSV